MSGEVSIFSSGTTRAEECGNRRGIVGRVEKLGRRRKLDVRGGSGHHFPTSNVQRPHQANRDPTEAEQGANPKWHFLYSKIRSGPFFVAKFSPKLIYFFSESDPWTPPRCSRALPALHYAPKATLLDPLPTGPCLYPTPTTLTMRCTHQQVRTFATTGTKKVTLGILVLPGWIFCAFEAAEINALEPTPIAL